MGITVLKHNAPWGPFNRAQIEEGLKRGDFTLQYLAHAPGLKEWLPLGEVLDHAGRGVTLPPVPSAQNLPPVPPPMPNPETLRAAKPIQVPIPPPVAPELNRRPSPSPPALPVSEKPEVRLETAPFLSRGMAFLIDGAILFAPILLICALSALVILLQGWWQHTDQESMRQEWVLLDRNFHRLVLLVAIGFGWLYGAGCECSPAQATVGKRWMGIKVTDAQGERISFLRATGRYAAKYLSALPCFLGFIMALFNSRGLALHDRLAGTRVTRR